ncbi:MAG: hypothetical protein C5B48_12890 [Candidatus Rokuibacteriota bacterium]|nr:MAG: hypothetical protein C5B48_12890 [Candidatus Rokubacteria bacterium]
MRFAELDAVTVDGYGTLLELIDPVPGLRQALAQRGVHAAAADISRAFEQEASYYRARAHLGRDEPSLQNLRENCAGVFLEVLSVELDPASFAGPFVDALEFTIVPGAVETLGLLRDQGLLLAVVANWDHALPVQLARLGVDHLFRTVVTSAEAGAPKPDPVPFRLALQRLGVDPARALHVGDDRVDEDGAEAAGMRFAPAPLAEAFAEWE